MTTALILNQAQAEAVYSAMCSLSAVGASLDAATIPNRAEGYANVQCQQESAVIRISRWNPNAGHQEEFHDNTAAFAIAYGLQQG